MVWAGQWAGDKVRRPKRTGWASDRYLKNQAICSDFSMARPGFEPGTPRFSGTGNWCRKSQKSPANRPVADRAYSTSIPVDCCSYPRVKDVADPPRPFRLLRATATWGSKASATPAPTRAAPLRPDRASGMSLSGRSQSCESAGGVLLVTSRVGRSRWSSWRHWLPVCAMANDRGSGGSTGEDDHAFGGPPLRAVWADRSSPALSCGARPGLAAGRCGAPAGYRSLGVGHRWARARRQREARCP